MNLEELDVKVERLYRGVNEVMFDAGIDKLEVTKLRLTLFCDVCGLSGLIWK